jgi:hypothetical protein
LPYNIEIVDTTVDGQYGGSTLILDTDRYLYVKNFSLSGEEWELVEIEYSELSPKLMVMFTKTAEGIWAAHNETEQEKSQGWEQFDFSSTIKIYAQAPDLVRALSTPTPAELKAIYDKYLPHISILENHPHAHELYWASLYIAIMRPSEATETPSSSLGRDFIFKVKGMRNTFPEFYRGKTSTHNQLLLDNIQCI